MTKIITNIFKIIFILLILVWTSLVITDYFRAKNNNKPLICLIERRFADETDTYYQCTSLGYKYYEHNEKNGTGEYGFIPAFSHTPLEERNNAHS